MEPEMTTTGRSLKDCVMGRIETEAISPRPRLFYTSRELAVWSLWIASIVIGAFAVAVVSFVLTHHEYALYEATHENFGTFLLEALPYVWFVTFAAMAVAAVYNLKHTKHGYRYPLWQIFGSSMVLSLAGGSVLHLFGFGYTIDHVLGRQVPMYMSEEKRDMQMWENPEEGRLLGSVMKQIEPPETMMTFTDSKGNDWKLDVRDLTGDEQMLLSEHKQVRLVGVVTDPKNRTFYSCGVFPWLLDKPASKADFEAVRKSFEAKMHRLEEKAESLVSSSTEVDEKNGSESPCGQIKPARRVRAEFQQQTTVTEPSTVEGEHTVIIREEHTEASVITTDDREGGGHAQERGGRGVE
jgi:hypothetical protein